MAGLVSGGPGTRPVLPAQARWRPVPSITWPWCAGATLPFHTQGLHFQSSSPRRQEGKWRSKRPKNLSVVIGRSQAPPPLGGLHPSHLSEVTLSSFLASQLCRDQNLPVLSFAYIREGQKEDPSPGTKPVTALVSTLECLDVAVI